MLLVIFKNDHSYYTDFESHFSDETAPPCINIYTNQCYANYNIVVTSRKNLFL